MKKRLLSTAVLAAITLTSGCSMIKKNPIYGEEGLIRDRNQEYEKATVAKKLDVPPHLQVKQTQDLLVIPAITNTASKRTGEFEVPRPEFFYADTGSEAVNLKKLGNQKIIVVDEPIASVWEKSLDFMKYNGIAVESADARQGVIESDWIIVDGPEHGFVDRWIKRITFQDIPGGTRNKLQIRLRPDPENYQRTSIEMRHVQFAEAQKEAVADWSSNEAQEVGYKSDMMFEMLRYMSKATTNPSERSLLAYQEKRANKPQLGRDSRGNPVLKLESHTDQSWELLSAAVDSAGFDVGTRDKATGMMYMTYTTTTRSENKKDMGFFEWLNSDRGEIKLGDSLSLLGGGSESEIKYSTKQALNQPLAEGQVQALDDPNNAANRKGYKIWFAGRVIYVFGEDAKKGNYNPETDSYEHTGRYQLKMTRTRSGIYISVLNQEGLSAPAIITDEILWTIKDNMPG